MLQPIGLPKVRHDLATEQKQQKTTNFRNWKVILPGIILGSGIKEVNSQPCGIYILEEKHTIHEETIKHMLYSLIVISATLNMSE